MPKKSHRKLFVETIKIQIYRLFLSQVKHNLTLSMKEAGNLKFGWFWHWIIGHMLIHFEIRSPLIYTNLWHTFLKKKITNRECINKKRNVCQKEKKMNSELHLKKEQNFTIHKLIVWSFTLEIVQKSILFCLKVWKKSLRSILKKCIHINVKECQMYLLNQKTRKIWYLTKKYYTGYELFDIWWSKKYNKWVNL